MEPQKPANENRDRGWRAFAAVAAAAVLVAIILVIISKLSIPQGTATQTPPLTASPSSSTTSSSEKVQSPTGQPVSGAAGSQTPSAPLTSISNLMLSQGSSNAPVVMVLYSDFL